MIQTIAIMGGYDPNDDIVQTSVYMCLIRASFSQVLNQAGVKIANKLTINVVKKVPYEIIKKINKSVKFRLITKFGKTGIINLSKIAPIVGGFVGGGIDFFETKNIANKAIDIFLLNKFE